MNCLLSACRAAQILLEHLFDKIVHAGNEQDGEYRDDDGNGYGPIEQFHDSVPLSVSAAPLRKPRHRRLRLPPGWSAKDICR